MTTSERRREALRLAFRTHADARDALRAFTGDSLAEIGRRVHSRRQDINGMLTRRRRYPHLRSAVELEYGLPAYSMDEVLDSTQPTTLKESA